MINVKFKKLRDDVKLPAKATDGSAAYDLYTPDVIRLHPGRQIVKLGFSMAMPYGIQGQVEPRSGYSCKGFEAYASEENMSQEDAERTVEIHNKWNCTMNREDADVIAGKVDSDYRGEVGVIVVNRSKYPLLLLKKHQRIAQLTFQKVEDVNFEEVDELDKTSRDGGYGHSGSGEIK